ncbi:hypothetical protein [Idiomarina piscisalsi]|uniref:Flagellar assembly protein T N-terminal domain-containing protein n=1 Tax=Idiomarina piscisalsi TaxID=1096243 RepID=A0A432YTL3_9GAMM|nr:hypothetical protein [Idiomarina piscisalsi]RUO66666.1 hypothetical protein CWI73_05120 [Idiomarina piscisalsi]
MRKLALSFGVLASVASFSALAQVSLSSMRGIEAEACAYGRGTPAIESAKMDALSQVAQFLSSPKLLAQQTSSEDIDTETSSWARKLSDMQQQGMSIQQMPVDISAPRLQGSDTCVTVRLKTGSLPKSNGQSAGGDWNAAAENVLVTVIGEGWPDNENGRTARTQAEMDALKRAVSQVVGMWLTQQNTQFSTTEESSSESGDEFSVNEVISQQLHTRSQGLVKEWSLLNSRELPNNGVEVTIKAVVEKQPIAQAANDVLMAIGSPRVNVQAPEPLSSLLKDWLAEQGIEYSSHANLVIKADSVLRARGANSRLQLNVTVEDLSGQQYGLWRNEPSLLSLPTSAQVEHDLIDVHLATPEQQQSLRKTLKKSFNQVVAQGGMVRDIFIHTRYLSQPDKLSSILSTLGGVKDVVVNSQGDYYKASLRYAGATGELVAALHQSVRPIAAQSLPKAQINNEFTIRFD